MFNFAYDYETYCEKRGLYLDLKEVLPCNINKNENTLIDEILNCDVSRYTEETKTFKARFCPNAGKATETVIKYIKQILK